MKKWLLIFSLLVSFIAMAQIQSPGEVTYQPARNQYTQNAEQCQDLECVRKNIDAVDSQIVLLIGQRLAYVKRAGELKPPATSVHDRTRELQILNKVGQEAANVGYSPVIARSVFSAILLQSNVFEQKYRDQ